ncbi:WW domain-containing adapter protein with coiled-coil isoform X2 [Gadus morhua]|uniref:WW domain-containing adapter protein with coiled-coil isoform X2 n=1 Tax=Gadus morhua TaxID=8049 RepID=UPI0011B71E19|nr:WW domain-containing adapter protein with coiled-coil-like isoform X2 [Gadus morhua]XP_056453556.1 WW domain-containing adapter protein with coiled-coil-like isoform X2 [Gadus chalcogrammus]
MVMHARKPARVSDGCTDRRHSQPYQPHKSQPKSQSGSVHRYDKVRDGSSEPTPPYKMLRRSDESPVSRPGDGTVGGHGRAKTTHTLGGKNGTSGSPQENPHNNNGAQHSSDSQAPQSRPTERRQEPADDWTEHISSSGKKYYYNCRTEVSQWEKPRDLLEREQRQKDSSKTTNSFPRDMDYRQEALQDKATAKSTSGDQPTGPNNTASHSSSSAPSASQSLSSALPSTLPSSSATSSSSTSSSSASSAAVQAQSSALLQDPAILHQLLPALQATLQMTNGSVDMAKINEVLAAAVTQASLRSMLHKLLAAGPSGYNVTALLSQAAAAAQHSSQAQQSSQSPVSLSSDTPSPRPYSSPRSTSTQSSASAGQKPMTGGGSASSAPSQSRGNTSSGKSGAALMSQSSVEKRPEDPRTLQLRSQENPSPGPNACGAGMAAASSTSSCGASQSQPSAPGSFTPSLATHFDENLIRHVQGWPGEHTEKQAARLREDFHNMGSLYMSEICTELKNLRSLVRVCEIQATLREQRILFLRQQSKELDKLKNQNSYMV